MGSSTDVMHKDVPFPDLNINETYYDNQSNDNLVQNNAPSIFSNNFRSQTVLQS